MNDARSTILSNIENALTDRPLPPEPTDFPVSADLSRSKKSAQLKSRMEAVQTEVHVVSDADWVDRIIEYVHRRKLNHLLFAPETELGKSLVAAMESHDNPLNLVGYTKNVEAMKETIFSVDAGSTTTLGAICDIGALILWPTIEEPRLMSLVPPVHIAVLRADQIYMTLSDAMKQNQWDRQMPANALLISGPSKTADIEFVLTYGVHGPKELVVFVIDA